MIIGIKSPICWEDWSPYNHGLMKISIHLVHEMNGNSKLGDWLRNNSRAWRLYGTLNAKESVEIDNMGLQMIRSLLSLLKTRVSELGMLDVSCQSASFMTPLHNWGGPDFWPWWTCWDLRMFRAPKWRVCSRRFPRWIPQKRWGTPRSDRSFELMFPFRLPPLSSFECDSFWCVCVYVRFWGKFVLRFFMNGCNTSPTPTNQATYPQVN